ncbi:MAG: acetolactate synthase small subunit [Clostridia bacterium]|nr:acetolactate synthase small subunit [Clostridia bacterium]
MKSVIAVYVENKYGVLARVCGLFLRRGFNIDSLTVSETEEEGYSRITLTTGDDKATLKQLVRQLEKLHNVKKVQVFNKETTVEHELLLVKIKNTEKNRSEVVAVASIYDAKIVDYTNDAIMIEVTASVSKLNAFIEVIKPMGIVEMCRTGVIALSRGNETLKDHK